MTTLLLLLVSIIPRDDVVRDEVDIIELNHFYDEQGRLIFDQVLFWDCNPIWCKADEAIRAWRLLKADRPKVEYDHRTKTYFCFWEDGEVLRKVTAPHHRETWTQYDPEILDRELHPKAARPELSKPAPLFRGVPAPLILLRDDLQRQAP